ncbi:MAG: hypothetical protein SWK76_07635 [Actinomycetota bacterium]|nr:hypothetical protein [Actinomycetota bacterium]
MGDDRHSGMEGYHNELRLFFYLMSGSLRDAEGLTRATLPQDPPHTDTNSTRIEIFKSASRLFMNTLADQPPRVLPRFFNPPSDPCLPAPEAEESYSWLKPFPDDLYPENGYAGDGIYHGRESVSLPFVAALQLTSARERLCSILVDAMGWSVEALAEILSIGIMDARRRVDEARESMSRSYDGAPGGGEPPEEDKEATCLCAIFTPAKRATPGVSRNGSASTSSCSCLHLRPGTRVWATWSNTSPPIRWRATQGVSGACCPGVRAVNWPSGFTGGKRKGTYISPILSRSCISTEGWSAR